jgi:hypothetical protein
MKRIVIDRLELDLRGIAPATAEAAARLIGPALTQALAQRRITAGPAGRLDAGRIDFAASPQPQALATRMAQQIASRTSRRSSS